MLGLRQIMFAVDSLEDAVERLRDHGATLVGEVVQYEDKYRLCCWRQARRASSPWKQRKPARCILRTA
jgi:hypothetical protein